MAGIPVFLPVVLQDLTTMQPMLGDKPEIATQTRARIVERSSNSGSWVNFGPTNPPTHVACDRLAPSAQKLNPVR